MATGAAAAAAAAGAATSNQYREAKVKKFQLTAVVDRKGVGGMGTS